MRTASLLCSAFTLSLGLSAADNYFVYFGTYSKGIYVSGFDAKTGTLEPVKLAVEVPRPSWVTIHPNGQFLYAVSEQGESAVTSFKINPATGELQSLNKVPAGGSSACHLAIDKGGKTISVANYGNGTVAVFALKPDGSIGERTGFAQHSGSGPDTKRQGGPHAHAVVLSADDKFLFVPDLGLDKVMGYRLAVATGSLSPNDPPFATVKPGSGPRHFAFHPKGKFAYALGEMGSNVTTFTYDAKKGSLEPIQTVTTLPEDFKGENNSAEIEVDRAGRYVYASNRGDDSIAVFAIDRGKGTLTHVQRVSTQGKIPRSFKIDPTGKHLIAVNQNSNNAVVYRIDGKTGQLTPTGQVLDVPSAVCVQFLPRR